MVLVPGSGLIGNLLVALCLLVVVVLMGRSLWRTMREADDDHDDRPPP